jgi:ubiquinone/menaquinone biosynthesis C-methylase UbiE
VKQLGLDQVIRFDKEDCLNLSYEDNTYDAVTAAFGIRNFQNLDQGLREMCRVLKKDDLERALIVLRKALEAYPGRVDSND